MYQFFFAAIQHNRLEEVHTLLYKYVDASAACIIGLETSPGVHQLTNGEHMHFAVQMTEAEWKLFYKTFVNKFNLGGKNSKDKSYYGKIKQDKVRDETNFLAYTVKDGNYWHKNIALEELQEYINKSFKKESKQSLDEAIQEHIKNEIWRLPSKDEIEKFIAVEIIHYYRVNKLKKLPNKYFIRSATLRYLMDNNEYSDETIYNYLYI